MSGVEILVLDRFELAVKLAVLKILKKNTKWRQTSHLRKRVSFVRVQTGYVYYR